MLSRKLEVKGILFDLDGTIIDTKPAYIAAAKVAFKTLKLELPTTALALQIPKRIELGQPFPKALKVSRETFLKTYLDAFYALAKTKTRPFPRVGEVLESLCAKAKMALITMRFVPASVVALELKQFHLEQYFEHVVTAVDTAMPKPSPEALIKAVKAMDLDMCTCVIVGDSVVDVKAGKAAGAKTVSVLTGLYSREELQAAEPDFLINNISELPKLLK